MGPSTMDLQKGIGSNSGRKKVLFAVLNSSSVQQFLPTSFAAGTSQTAPRCAVGAVFVSSSPTNGRYEGGWKAAPSGQKTQSWENQRTAGVRAPTWV